MVGRRRANLAKQEAVLVMCSCTNRGAVRSTADFYATPETAFKPLIPLLDGRLAHHDPASGDGRLVRWMAEAGFACSGSDLRADGWPLGGVDFLTDDDEHDVIITNPPFSLAQEFVDQGLGRSRELWLLLRLNFLGAQCRRDWWSDGRAPNALFVLSDRPKFAKNANGKLGSDGCEYAWFYWGRRFQGIRHL